MEASVSQNEKNKGIFIRRCLVLVVGLFFYSSGANITKNCMIGISPIISVAYTISLISPITMGWGSSLFNVSHFFIQKALLKKEYTLRILLGQIVVSILFSVFIDMTALIWQFLTPQTYPFKLLQLIIGCFVLAFGVYLMVVADLVTMSGEGVCLAITKRTGWAFGNVKVGFDAACVVISVIVTLLVLGQIEGIREGTLIAVILVGNFTKLWAKWLKKPLDVILQR